MLFQTQCVVDVQLDQQVSVGCKQNQLGGRLGYYCNSCAELISYNIFSFNFIFPPSND